jgi:peptide subunit release factor 1 (eRF1)
MTWAAMKCDPAETSRRQTVCARLNKLWSKREHTEDKQTRKRLDREINRIRSDESHWLKEAAFWLY